MSAVSHTPGPWSAVAVTSGAKRKDLVYVKIHADRTVGYAAVTHGARDEGEVGGAYAEHPTLSRKRGVTISEAEALANGHLIAAAPRMLQALEVVAEHFGLDDLSGFSEEQQVAIEVVRSAITLARGGR